MTTAPHVSPVEDSVGKVNDSIAVGENLQFQQKWWKFEQLIWGLFIVILLCDLLGLFGRGWLSKASTSTPDGDMKLEYERFERAGTPSIMTFTFASGAIHNGKIELFVSDSVVKPLGAQRVSPQPATSVVGADGITYSFPASVGPAVIQIALEPSFPGRHPFRVRLVGSKPIDVSVLVFP
jgi:hypothetical protein